ncbi:hypothetical protein [Halobacteriovorax sp. RT-2-6]|uniref:hypothetical protein n=1 Tax=unclassified Halobacteriovorax TaxID=2639665 RepID=UPI00399BF2B4
MKKRIFRSLIIFYIGLNTNQVYGKSLDFFLKSKGDNHNYFIQTSASLGMFKEKTSNRVLKTQKNSPMTLTAGISYFPVSIEKLSLVALGSISYLVASEIESDSGSSFSNNLKLKPELGASFYAHKSYTYRNSTGFFGGVDYEVFNLYNSSKFLDGESLDTEVKRIYYGTLGLTFAQKIITPFVLNLSFSQSVNSQRGLSGQRYQINYSQKYSENMWYNIFAKRHELKNDYRQLSITRLGIGVGFYY